MRALMRRPGPSLVTVLLLAAVVYLVVTQLDKDDKPTGVTVVLVLLGAGLLYALVAPEATLRLLDRVTKFKVGGVEVAFERERAARVARTVRHEEDGVALPPRPRTGDAALDILRVQEMLRRRLRYVRRHVLELGDEWEIIDVVAALQERELLGVDEARVLYDLLESPLLDWTDGEREAFLDNVWQLVYRLASLTFDRRARRALKDAGWAVADFAQDTRHRPDFLAIRDGATAIVAARTGSPWRSLALARARLSGDVPKGVDRRIVVVPDRTDIQADREYPAVEVVSLRSLLDTAQARPQRRRPDRDAGS